MLYAWMSHYSRTKEPKGRGNWVSKEGTRNGGEKERGSRGERERGRD